jgi:hypothetical protein
MARTAPSLIASILVLAAALPVGASRLEIASEEDGARQWQRSNRVPPPAWPEQDAGVDAACVNLGFRIERDGRTSGPMLLSAWAPEVPSTPEGQHRLAAFAQSAALTMSDWKYEPTAENRRERPLITNVVFVFAREAGTDLAGLRRNCLVGDLRDFLYRKAEEGYRRGNLNKGLIERRREEFPRAIPDGCTRHPGWCD